MKDYSLNPTNDNVIEMLKLDPLNRNKDIISFINILNAIDDSCSIALNSEWGNGKTFFVKQVKLLLDYSNDLSDIDDETRDKLSFFKDSYKCNESFSTVYYDAWENDNEEDPILSLIYATILSDQTDHEPAGFNKLIEKTPAIIDALAGKNISSILKSDNTNIWSSFKKTQDIHSLISEFIDALIEERGNRLVIFIDELDRCKPIYAVQLLERIKHYFNDDRITFVFSVSISQLQHTIKSYYGNDFDATRYLDKFFDLRIALSNIDYDLLFNYKFQFIKSSDIFDKVCIQTVKHFRFSIRETKRYMRLIQIAENLEYASNNKPETSEEIANRFSFMYITPILLGLGMADIDLFYNFINGINFGPMQKILLNVDSSLHRTWILRPNQCFSDDPQRDAYQEVVSKEDILNEIYISIFVKEYSHKYLGTNIGDAKFSEQTRHKIFQSISLLSPNIDYSSI